MGLPRLLRLPCGTRIDLQPIDAARLEKHQDVVVRIGDEELLDEIILLRRRRLLAAPAALLRAVVGDRLALHVAAVRNGDHHVLGCDQVFHREVLRILDDLAAAFVPVLLFHIIKLAADDPRDAFRPRENIGAGR